MLIVKSKIRKDYPAHAIEIVVGVNGFEELPEAVLADLVAMGVEILDTKAPQAELDTVEDPAPVSRKRK